MYFTAFLLCSRVATAHPVVSHRFACGIPYMRLTIPTLRIARVFENPRENSRLVGWHRNCPWAFGGTTPRENNNETVPRAGLRGPARRGPACASCELYRPLVEQGRVGLGPHAHPPQRQALRRLVRL